MRLAEFLARRFAHRGEAADDLRQVALVGLLKAVERFEPDRGLQFSSFATPTITGELKRYFRDRGWAVRVPRRIQELHLELDRTVNDAQPGARPAADAGGDRATRRRARGGRPREHGGRAASTGWPRSTPVGPTTSRAPSPAQRLGEIDAELDRGRRPGRGERDALGAARAGAEDRVPAVLRRPDPVGDRRARSASARCTSRVCWCGVSRRWDNTHPSSRSSEAWTTTCPGPW